MHAAKRGNLDAPDGTCCDVGLGAVPAQQVEQQRGDQRPVDDEAG